MTVVGVLLVHSLALTGLGAIMPVGDSITDGDCSSNLLGFRDDLASLLSQAGFSFSYVGDVWGQAGNPAFPGHFLQGAVIEQFYPPWFGNGWGRGDFDIGPSLQTYHPDVLLIHLGTNHLWDLTTPLGPYSLDGGQTLHRSVAGSMAELLRYILTFYPDSPSTIPLVVLSLIIPAQGQVERVTTLNGYLAQMAQDFAAGVVTGHPVHVVMADHFSPFMANPSLFTGQPGDYLCDGVHPNDTGYGVMAQVYFQALADHTPPAPVRDLVATVQDPPTVLVGWTWPGDDLWVGLPRYAFVRCWGAPITTLGEFSSAWDALGPVTCTGPGWTSVPVGGLPSGATYWFALRVADEAGNLSDLSNTVQALVPQSPRVVQGFDTVSPGTWVWGDDYHVAQGMLVPSSPWPTWLRPAIFVGEASPVGAELTVPPVAPVGELYRVGVVVGAGPSQTTDGWVLGLRGSTLLLWRMQGGVVGAAVDSATSHWGPLAPGERLGAFLLTHEGELLVRATRNGAPDALLTTGVPTSGLPPVRHAGIVMRGGCAWGVEEFAVEGPTLWEPPGPFHLVAPESAAQVASPPTLVWRASHDPDPWDGITYRVEWSTDPRFAPLATTVLEAGADTTLAFPPSQFQAGSQYYWRVKATDGTGLSCSSVETWWFSTAAEADQPRVVRWVRGPWPVPARDRLTICLASPQRVELVLVDGAGRMVCGMEGSAHAGEPFTWVLPPHLARGWYILAIRTRTEETRAPVLILP